MSWGTLCCYPLILLSFLHPRACLYRRIHIKLMGTTKFLAIKRGPGWACNTYVIHTMYTMCILIHWAIWNRKWSSSMCPFLHTHTSYIQHVHDIGTTEKKHSDLTLHIIYPASVCSKINTRWTALLASVLCLLSKRWLCSCGFIMPIIN